tara:strand:+ start:711 stop:1004 length:294 start_codon:yes stop_codon:yes gene_type:complete
MGGAVNKVVSKIISKPKPQPPATVAQARTTYKDSAGKNYDTKEARDAAQIQLERKQKFGIEKADPLKMKVQRSASAGRPNIRIGSIGGVGGKSGVSI